MIQKLIKRFAPVAGIHGRVDQFAQVFYAGVGVGRVFCFEQLDVTGAVDEKLQNISRAGSWGCSAGILPAVVEASGLHIVGRRYCSKLRRRRVLGHVFISISKPEIK